MRLLLILTISSPFVDAFSQNDDPRIALRAPSADIASVEVKTIRYRVGRVENKERTELQRLLDIHPKKDSLFIDTLKREKIWFGQDGKPDSSFYDFHTVHTDYYSHFSDSSWCVISKSEYTRKDSTVVDGDSAVTYTFYDGKLNNRLVYSGSVAHHILEKKPQKHPNWYYWVSSPEDSFWDYRAAGLFCKRIVMSTGSIDTVLYNDASGKWIVKTINHTDANGRCIRSDYYNRGANRFALVRLWANHHIGDATLYLECKGEAISMRCERKYDAAGLLMEETWYQPGADQPLYRRTYCYSLR